MSLEQDAEKIKEIKRLTFNLEFEKAFSLTRHIENNEFAVRTALIVMAAEYSHANGNFKGNARKSQ